jgi:hypothetical protein
MGFQERTESFDFNVTLQDHFKYAGPCLRRPPPHVTDPPESPRHLDAEKKAEERLKQWEAQPKQDFSLKEVCDPAHAPLLSCRLTTAIRGAVGGAAQGQTMSISIKSVAVKAPSAASAAGTGGLLPPPPAGGRLAPPPGRSAAPIPAAAPGTASADAGSVWGDFAEFQAAPGTAPASSGYACALARGRCAG